MLSTCQIPLLMIKKYEQQLQSIWLKDLLEPYSMKQEII